MTDPPQFCKDQKQHESRNGRDHSAIHVLLVERILHNLDGSNLLIVAAFETNMNGARRNELGGAFRPFDDGDAIGFKIFIEP